MAGLITDLTDQTSDALRRAAAYLDDATTPTLRLGITGLARSGKTVFITALVRALTEPGADPAITPIALPGYRAFLEPQPNDELPRFAYEDHLAALTATPSRWPDSTRHISQLRVTLEWDPGDWLRRTAGVRRRLHIDIIDYPGEWLSDVGLLEQEFAVWSAHTAALARAALARATPATAARTAWLAFEAGLPNATSPPEQLALEGARLFTAHLAEQKAAGRLPPSAGPGRFLMPGDYEGSPLLTFFPLVDGPAPLHTLLARRYDSYRSTIVKPFFEKHFSRIERQIVLVDVLGALNLGPAAVLEMENALERALSAFRPGRDSWLGRLIGQRVDSILFAATKADHLHSRNHRRLEAILAKVVDRARARARDAGARHSLAAIAALRTTEDVERQTTVGAAPLDCVRGIPLDGQRLAGKPLDPAKPLTVFPGDLPADPLDAFDPAILAPGSLEFVRFRPRITTTSAQPDPTPHWPHVGLGRAIAFLLGDRLS